MKRTSIALSILVLGSLVLAACAAPTQLPAEPEMPQEPAATEAPQEPAPTEAPAEAPTAAAPEAAPTAAPAAAPSAAPGELPAGDGAILGDHSTLSSLNAGRALVGDRFNENKFERPYNANTMDVYFPNLDIDSGNVYQEGDWVYARIRMVSPDANGGFPGQFALEGDTELDGRGDFLVLAAGPTSTDWTTSGVQVLVDSNGDVGGEKILVADTIGSSGDGYDTVVFDQGAGDDPGLAWVRLSPTDPNSVEMAFNASVLQGDDKFQLGFWAATNAIDPALFDLNDHYTHEQAGAALDDFEVYYPIKGLAELDNTCRVAVGFNPSSPLLAGCGGQ